MNNRLKTNSPSDIFTKILQHRASQSGGATVDRSIAINRIRQNSLALGEDITYAGTARNLVKYSEEFSQANWTKANSTILSNVISNPINGEVTGSKIVEDTVLTSHLIQQNYTFSVGKTYTYSAFIGKGSERHASLNAGASRCYMSFNTSTGVIDTYGDNGIDANVISANVEDYDSNWWRASLTFEILTTVVIYVRISLIDILLGNVNSGYGTTYTGDGVSGVYVYGAQLEEGSVVTDYQYTSLQPSLKGASLIYNPSTIGEGKAYCVRPDLRNLCTNTNNGFTFIGTVNSISTTTTSPFGTDDARTAQGVSITSRATVNTNSTFSVKPNTNYVFSLYAKSNTPVSKNMGFNAGGVSSNRSCSLTTEWQRFEVTITTINNGAVTNNTGLSLGNTGEEISFWGFQIEEGTVATPYQRTTDGIIDFNVSRATSATVISEDGSIKDACYNLLQYSEDFSNASWAKSNISINLDLNTINPFDIYVTRKLVPNTVNDFHQISQSNVLKPYTNYSFSFYVKASEYDTISIVTTTPGDGSTLQTLGTFNLTSGTVIASSNATNTIEYIKDGWYRVVQTFDSVLGGSSTFRIRPNGNSQYIGNDVDGLYVFGCQLETNELKPYLKTTDRLNVPSIDYSLGEPHLLVEPGRTNLITRSEDQTFWTMFNSTAVNDGISPYGIISNIFETNVTGATYISSPNTISWTLAAYTQTFIVKKTHQDWVQIIGSSTNFGTDVWFNVNLVTGAVGNKGAGSFTYTVTELLDGWWKITMTATAISTTAWASNFIIGTGGVDTATRVPSVVGNSANSICAVAYCQTELGSFETSHIPTTSASVTRNLYSSYIDLANNNLLNKDNFTLYVEGYTVDGSAVQLSIGLGGNANGTLSSDCVGWFNNFTGIYRTSDVQTSITTLIGDNEQYKAIIQRNGTEVKWFLNGVQQGSTQSIPIYDYPYLTFRDGGSSYKISQLELYKRTLTDAECIAKTTL